MSSHDRMSLQLPVRIVKGRNDRSNSNYKQIILDTQRAPAAGGYAICLQLCRSLKENSADKRW